MTSGASSSEKMTWKFKRTSLPSLRLETMRLRRNSMLGKTNSMIPNFPAVFNSRTFLYRRS